MVIGGDWADSDARLEATSPASGESLGSVPEGTREDAQTGDRGGERRLARLVAPLGVRARRGDGARRRPDRRAPRRARADADARPGQAAAQRVVRRGGRARRVLAHGGRGREAAGRVDAAVGRRVEADPRLPRPARRRRRDHAVELALHDARRAARAGARSRQRRRLGAGLVDLDLRGEARRVHRRRRAPGRRLLDGDRAAAPSSATRSPAARARTRSASSARSTPA